MRQVHWCSTDRQLLLGELEKSFAAYWEIRHPFWFHRAWQHLVNFHHSLVRDTGSVHKGRRIAKQTKRTPHPVAVVVAIQYNEKTAGETVP